jgi:hypothetical protein
VTASHPDRPAGAGARRTAGALTLVEGLVVVGFGAFYGYEIATGAAADVTRAATSGLLILVFGLGLLWLARGWLVGRDWPRTPTLLWNALLLPVAWSLHESDRTEVALGVAGLAVASLAAALASPMRRDRGGADEEDDRAGGGSGSAQAGPGRDGVS